ncbi:hypothetical protein M758_7G170300 [Ceratodon purpureus]|nr:hypothetical protein M758_7G170300 [Ceratodon purpureus]
MATPSFSSQPNSPSQDSKSSSSLCSSSYHYIITPGCNNHIRKGNKSTPCKHYNVLIECQLRESYELPQRIRDTGPKMKPKGGEKMGKIEEFVHQEEESE